MQTTKEVIALAIRLNIVNENEISGCTEEEVRALEHELNTTLPKEYREFLLWGGKQIGDFLGGSFWQYFLFSSGENSLVVLQQSARDLLIENNFPQTLPENAFAFLMHQGYKFYFFPVDEGDNPPLYLFFEGDENDGISTPIAFRKEFCSFTEFLEYKVLAQYLARNGSASPNFYLLQEQYKPCIQ